MVEPVPPSEPATFLPIPNLEQLEHDIIGLIEQQQAAHPPHLITPATLQDLLGHIQIATDLLNSTLYLDDNNNITMPNPSKSVVNSRIPSYKVETALQHLCASTHILSTGPPEWRHALPRTLAERTAEIESLRAELGWEANIKNSRMIEARYMLGEVELFGRLASVEDRVPRCGPCERLDEQCVVVDHAMEVMIRKACCAWCYCFHTKCEDPPREV